jgi:hypothetical protein
MNELFRRPTVRLSWFTLEVTSHHLEFFCSQVNKKQTIFYENGSHI